MNNFQSLWRNSTGSDPTEDEDSPEFHDALQDDETFTTIPFSPSTTTLDDEVASYTKNAAFSRGFRHSSNSSFKAYHNLKQAMAQQCSLSPVESSKVEEVSFSSSEEINLSRGSSSDSTLPHVQFASGSAETIPMDEFCEETDESESSPSTSNEMNQLLQTMMDQMNYSSTGHQHQQQQQLPLTPIQLITNHFVLGRKRNLDDMRVYRHCVHIDSNDPAMIKTIQLNTTLYLQSNVFGPYLYEYDQIYTMAPIARAGLPFTRHIKICTEDANEDFVETRIRFIAKLDSSEPDYERFFNQVLSKLLNSLELVELNGFQYHNASAKLNFPSMPSVEVWPGYNVFIGARANSALTMCVNPVQEFVTVHTVLDVINHAAITGGGDVFQLLKRKKVITTYNHRVYKILGIDWIMTPDSKLTNTKTFAEYYLSRYFLQIENMHQPLLIACPIKNHGVESSSIQPTNKNVYLIPEFCQLIGLSPEMINYDLIRNHIWLTLQERLTKIQDFREVLMKFPSICQKLEVWDFYISGSLLKCNGIVLPKEKMYFRNGLKQVVQEFPDENNGWATMPESYQMLHPVNIENWALVTPFDLDYSCLIHFITCMEAASLSLGVRFCHPTVIFKRKIHTLEDYNAGLDDLLSHAEFQFILLVIPFSAPEFCFGVMEKVSVSHGVVSQCVPTKFVLNKAHVAEMSRKLMIQINIKLGGEPWNVQLPLMEVLEDLMIVGFNFVHEFIDNPNFDKNEELSSKARVQNIKIPVIYGATVASLNSRFTKYFNTILKFDRAGQLGNLLQIELLKCLEAYKLENHGEYPARIIFYHGSVAFGEIDDSKQIELDQIQAMLDYEYYKVGLEAPELAFIIVNKKDHTKLFTTTSDNDEETEEEEKEDGDHDIEMNNNCPRIVKNPPVGTLIQNTITLDDKNDFYLMSQSLQNDNEELGVAATYYNILYSTSGFNTHQLQRLSYIFCHLAFNSYGSTDVPAPLHYTKDLLSNYNGLASGLGQQAHSNLSTKLNFI